ASARTPGATTTSTCTPARMAASTTSSRSAPMASPAAMGSTPTSETGMRSNSRRAHGFTLIELMVVVVIIGLIAATVVLSVGVTGRDTELEKESDRVFSLFNYAREKAEVQTHEFGFFCNDSTYEFLTFDPRKQIWRSVDEDDSLRRRELPEGLRFH